MSFNQFLIGCSLAFGCLSCADFQERELIKRELSGPLIKLEDIQHGQSFLYIKDNKTHDTVRYALRVTKFLRENNIHEGDSIAKESESYVIWFYKKKEGKYQKAVRLYYN